MPRQRRIIPPIDQSFDEAMNIIIANFNPDDDDDLYQTVKKKQEEREQDSGENDTTGSAEGLQQF